MSITCILYRPNSLTTLHEFHHLADGHVSLVRRASGSMKQSFHFFVAQKGILTTNVGQHSVKALEVDLLVVGFFDHSDDVLAESRWQFVGKAVRGAIEQRT